MFKYLRLKFDVFGGLKKRLAEELIKMHKNIYTQLEHYVNSKTQDALVSTSMLLGVKPKKLASIMMELSELDSEKYIAELKTEVDKIIANRQKKMAKTKVKPLKK